MGRKKEHVVYTNAVPLRDRGILAKPMSPKETEIESSIKSSVEHLEKNTSVERSEISIFNFYKAWVNSRMPGTAEAEKSLLVKALKSLRLVIEQQRGNPMRGFIEQRMFPTPLPDDKLRVNNPRFNARTEDLDPEDKVLVVNEKPVTRRLVVTMDYDLTRPFREQILEFSSESELLVEQFCVFRDTKEEDDGEEAKS